MILKTFISKFFKYLIRRRFALRRKFFFFKKNSSLKNETLKIKDFENNSIRSFKKIIEIDFSSSNFN